MPGRCWLIGCVSCGMVVLVSELMPFAFDGHRVRVVVVGGDPWFVAADVTRALGLSNGRDAVSRVDQDGVGIADVIDSLGRRQSAKTLSEAALYELVFQSRVPGAVAFRRWVTGEVLPSIEAERAAGLEAKIVADAPKVEAWEGLASGGGSFAVADAAKMLGQVGIETGRDRLFEFMHAIGWVFRRGGRWQAMQSAVNAKRLVHKPQSHSHPDTGERVLDAPQVRVTVKGLNEMRVLMQEPIPVLPGGDVGV